jgi:hypothetical protein
MEMKQKKNTKLLKKTEIFKTANSQYLKKKYGLVLGLVQLSDAKGIDVAQPIWP